MNPRTKYPISLYLNQKYVFDILATMEDGFSQLQTLKTTLNKQQQTATKFAADIGVSNVFAFLGVTLGAQREKEKQQGETTEKTLEKVYTPNSLFAKMRSRLTEEKLLRDLKDLPIDQLVPGEFVEFAARLSKNPLIDAFEALRSFEDLAKAVPGIQQGQIKKPQQGQGRKASSSQFAPLLDELKNEGGVDLVGIVLPDAGIRVVITLDMDFLSDPTLSDLLDGEYTILGKVTKVVRTQHEDDINLLRKTAFGRIKDPAIFESLDNILEEVRNSGFDIPEMETRIKGPALQVIPIAIYI